MKNAPAHFVGACENLGKKMEGGGTISAITCDAVTFFEKGKVAIKEQT
jgi:hypothetical protein